MSEYVEIKVSYTDRQILADAIAKVCAEMGVALEVHDTPKKLVGWKGRQRSQTAEFIVRQNQLNTSSNDMGWGLREDGTYGVHVSAYDQSERMIARQLADAVDVEYTTAEIKRQIAANPDVFYGAQVHVEDVATGGVNIVIKGVEVKAGGGW